MQLYRIFFILLFCTPFLCQAASYETAPVSHNGRFLPLDAYARLKTAEFYGKQQIKKSDLSLFNLKDNIPSTFLLKLYFYGSTQFNDSPLFSIHYAELKKILGLNPRSSHFSYNQLKSAIFEDENTNLELMKLLIPYYFVKSTQEQSLHAKSNKQELKALAPALFVTLDQDRLIITNAPNSPPWHFLKKDMVIKNDWQSYSHYKSKVFADEAVSLLSLLNQYKSYQGIASLKQDLYKNRLLELQENEMPAKEIALLLETEFPLTKRLETAGTLFKMLPSKKSETWVSLEALALKIYDSKTNALIPIPNFTVYSNVDYSNIQNAYLKVDQSEQNFETAIIALNKAYANLAGTPSKEAFQKKLLYPTHLQLQAEYFYYTYPLTLVTIILYVVALVGLIFGKTLNRAFLNTFSLWVLSFAFIFHTAILSLRCFILMRPPVSNMYETVIYVPWIAMIAGFVCYLLGKNTILLIASCISSVALLIVLEVTGMNEQLENVQAVLDSQYWLIVHVLLIVGSYGVFFLCGILGQIYLAYSFFNKEETEEMKFLSKFVLQTMYLGIFMLIPGTILGGVWAAESWGRFWDFDPKESWAFISSCIYLIFIHAYRFRKISAFALCVGAVIGFMAISFTWYGVNYILGTGLHSYGFGSGKDLYYYLFLLIQLFFLIIISLKHKKHLEIKRRNMI